jgi:hypothetical protein
MILEVALLSALLSGLFALAQRDCTWLLLFAWLSYASMIPVVLTAAKESWVACAALAVSFAFLLNVTMLMRNISKIMGSKLSDLEGAVSKYPAEGWLLVWSLLALTALPPFASFTLVEVLLPRLPATSALMLTATRVLWLAAFARPAVTVMLRVESRERRRTPLAFVSAAVFLLALLFSLLLFAYSLG